MYLIGYPFHLITDNKGIEWIFKNPNSKPPPRIQRMRLRLSPYEFTVIHKPGNCNISDYLSRHPLTSVKDLNKHARIFDVFAIQIIESVVLTNLRLKELELATASDPVLQLLKTHLKRRNQKIRSPQLKPFRAIYHQLSITPSGNLLLKKPKTNCTFFVTTKNHQPGTPGSPGTRQNEEAAPRQSLVLRY